MIRGGAADAWRRISFLFELSPVVEMLNFVSGERL